VFDAHRGSASHHSAITEKLLNHVSGSMGGIVGIYQCHDFMDEMREAISRYDAWLLHILGTAE
jgi:hypothetical protein